MATKETVTQVMVILASAYPRFQVPKNTGRIYAELLADIPDNLLILAAKTHAANSTFFPSVAELRKAAFGIQAKAQGIPSTAEAWDEVCRQIRYVGSWGTPRFSSHLISRAVEGLGGWRALCVSENPVADRAHFLKIYDRLLQDGQEDAALLPEVRELLAAMAEERTVARLKAGYDAD